MQLDILVETMIFFSFFFDEEKVYINIICLKYKYLAFTVSFGQSKAYFLNKKKTF